MAIQDFLSGGFYGKVGDVVGQRWHNKRYIRAYVKPTNPNTPAQQKNRSLFAKANKLAQMAFNINKGEPAWNSSEKGEYSMRVGTAMNRLKAGMSETDALPLFPDGYIPDHTLTDPVFINNPTPISYIITSNDSFNCSGRSFGIVIFCLNVLTNTWENIEFPEFLNTTNNFYFLWLPDNTHSYPFDSTFTASTTDDAVTEKNSIFFPSFGFEQTETPTITVEIEWGNFSEEEGWLNLNPQLSRPISGENESFAVWVHIFSLFENNWVDFQSTVEITPEGTVSDFLELGSENQARAGSYIIAGETIIERGEAFLKISWPRKDFTWP
jgi:hypothetical protein